MFGSVIWFRLFGLFINNIFQVKSKIRKKAFLFFMHFCLLH